jgi:hypothetical protein
MQQSTGSRTLESICCTSTASAWRQNVRCSTTGAAALVPPATRSPAIADRFALFRGKN